MFSKPRLWFALLGALAALGLVGAGAAIAAPDGRSKGGTAASSPTSLASKKRSAKRKGCAGKKGTKLRRCRALAKCKKLKGKKKKRCRAKARRIGKKKKQQAARQPVSAFQPGPLPDTPPRIHPPPLDRPSSCVLPVRYNAANFPSTPNVNNRWLPLTPGKQLVLEGRANRGGGPLPHQVSFTVTDLVKVIDGVPNLVMYDVDTNEGTVVEAELAFFAQDNGGRVWNFGEYPEEYVGGLFSGAPNTWLQGVGGAEAGVHMRAAPLVGTDWYMQGSVPDIDFLDCAKVVERGASACVPSGCYQNVLVTYETSPLDPTGGIQTKYHAPGVGIFQVGAVQDPEGETLVAVSIGQLAPAQLQQVRNAALALDQRAFTTRPDIWGATQPATQLQSGAGGGD